MVKPNIYWIDLFCGAGGTSTGIHLSGCNSKVLACVNHDKNAILSHQANHPSTFHFTEDIRDFNVVVKLKVLVNKIKAAEPDAIINIWASLECTNHSKAKGGLSKDADSRTLANHMYMYLEALNPDFFYVENVREFLDWGPIQIKVIKDKTENGLYCPLDWKIRKETPEEKAVRKSLKIKYKKRYSIHPVWEPIKERKKEYYNPWVERIKSYGYQYDYKILNSADYGARQSRERLFIQFARHNYRIAWAEPTHAKEIDKTSLLPLKKWQPVRDVLDLNDEGISIFERKKALSDNTLKRIHAGLVKFVANGEEIFTKRYNGGKIKPEQKVNSINKPLGTILTNNTHALVKSVFINKYYSGKPESMISSVKAPAPTLRTKDGQAVVISTYLNTYYGNGGTSSIEHPSPTLTTKDRIAKVNVNFIDQQYGNSKPASIDKPLGTLTQNPKFNLVSPWIMDTNYNNVDKSIEEPSQTVMACHKHRYLVNPQFKSAGRSIEEPCFTLIARMDKRPPSVVTVESGNYCIHILPEDTPAMVSIKEFMVKYKIIDIKMRMLNIQELKRIQGFPTDYKLIGTLTEQKKYIGNAVEVNQAKALIKANYQSILSR